MANVSLRSYNREIESLIDKNQLDEAIAHCRHILQTFPKHLETYRLLGKTYLESKRYDEAVDVFSRVLMCVPDDFVSHVGMSIIRDEQNKLDESIWHMERAFEAQPSNAAIQGELQRLFGRRDGVEPSKIRMTRGALAHMYVQGELFPQAISEIKAVLAQDGERDDMKSLLARAYFHAGQRADASDICSQLLQRYPYALDPNRIMVELLQGSNKPEDREVYRERVNELDPYAALVTGSVFQSNEVADSAVSLERLEYRGQDIPLSTDWTPPGISAGTAAAAEQPDWLKADYSSMEQPAMPASESKPEIPDFLRAAGWEESTGAAQESAPLDMSAESSEGGEIAPGEMPDWLKAMAPMDSQPASEPAPASGDASGTPDWLSDLRSTGPAPEESQVPDWLSSIEASQPEAAPSSAETAIPDWLKPEVDSAVPESAPVEAAPPAQASTPPAIPTEAPNVPASLDTLGTSAQEQDDAMAWLESLAAKHGAKSEELVTDPNARTDKPPEWVEQARALGEAAPAAPISEPAPAQPAESSELDFTAFEAQESAEFLEPQSEQPVQPEATAPLEPSTDETGVWLRGLEDKETSGERIDFFASETEPAKPDEPLSGMDTWLTEPGTPAAEEPASSAVPASIDLPDWLRGLDESDKIPGTASLEDELPGWLQAEPESAPAAEPTSPADWHPVVVAPEPELTPEEMEAAPEPAQEYLKEAQELREREIEPEPEAEPELEPDLQQEARYEPPQQEAPRQEVPQQEAPWQEAPQQETPRQEAPRQEPQPERRSEPPAEKPAAVRRPAVERRAVERRAVAPVDAESDPALVQAQTDINRGNIPAALEQYGRLIKRGRFLEEIIRDLRDALYRYPVEVTIWQTLGDAYMRENRLQEALDSYTKAEELLR